MAKPNRERHAKMRVIHIRNANGKLLSSAHAGSLREGLQNYYRNTLIPAGFRDPNYVGNTLSVTFKRGRITDICKYTATEAK